MNLSANIAGVHFPNCIMNAAGARCVTQEELEALGRSHAGAIVTKSMTPLSRSGNPEPRYVSFAGGSINSMGLPNLGFPAYAKIIPSLRKFEKPIIASIAGLSEQDFYEAAEAINAVKPDLMEVNLSCPNLPGKPQIGYDFDTSKHMLSKLRRIVTVPMGVKLPPYFDPAHHAAVGMMLKEVGGITFLSLINSVGNGLVVDPEKECAVIKPKGGFGGLGGRIIKPVALANVRAFWKQFEGQLPIIGTGGIETGIDVFEHVLCGATAVQVGTVLMEEGLGAFDRLAKELAAVLEQKGYQSLDECRGKLKEL